MKMLQKGDKCPMCGRPIKTDDPNKLIVLSSLNWIMEQRGGGDVCEDGSAGATNADKLRSLPDEELNELIMCPEGIGDFNERCKLNSDEKEAPDPDCFRCSGNWLKEPYIGWNNEKKS